MDNTILVVFTNSEGNVSVTTKPTMKDAMVAVNDFLESDRQEPSRLGSGTLAVIVSPNDINEQAYIEGSWVLLGE